MTPAHHSLPPRGHILPASLALVGMVLGLLLPMVVEPVHLLVGHCPEVAAAARLAGHTHGGEHGHDGEHDHGKQGHAERFERRVHEADTWCASKCRVLGQSNVLAVTPTRLDASRDVSTLRRPGFDPLRRDNGTGSRQPRAPPAA